MLGVLLLLLQFGDSPCPATQRAQVHNTLFNLARGHAQGSVLRGPGTAGGLRQVPNPLYRVEGLSGPWLSLGAQQLLGLTQACLESCSRARPALLTPGRGSLTGAHGPSIPADYLSCREVV